MSKKFRVGQTVCVGDEFTGVIKSQVHTRKGPRWIVVTEGDEVAVEEKNLSFVSGEKEPASRMTGGNAFPLPTTVSDLEQAADEEAAAANVSEGEGDSEGGDDDETGEN